jgi:hypothetical protein
MKTRCLGVLSVICLLPAGLWAQDPAATDFAINMPNIPQNTTAFASFYPQVPSPIHSGVQVPNVNAQHVGHIQTNTFAQRVLNKIEDKKDRCPCCGYGKTHNDMGVPGHLATKAFYFGGACEFFSEPCRIPQRPEREDAGSQRRWSIFHGHKDEAACATCGK